MSTRLDGFDYDGYEGDWKKPLLRETRREFNILPNDSATYMLHEEYQIFGRYHKPLAPGSRHPKYPNLFYVEDTAETPMGLTAHTFTRTWVSLPGLDSSGRVVSYLNQTYESFVWTTPGIAPSEYTDIYHQWTVASAVNSSQLTIHATATHDIAVGKLVLIIFNVRDPLNGDETTHQILRKSLAGTSGATLVVSPITNYGSMTFLAFKRADVKQDPYQINVNSRISRVYYLPGVNIPSVNNIPRISQFFIIGDKGNRSEFLNDDSTPTLDQYTTYVDQGKWIAAEPSQYKPWKGAIYEWTLREVQAIL